MHPTDTPEPAPSAAALPRAVAWLGYGGLLPFLAGAGAVLLQLRPDLAGQALLAYGAVILSFVGALHWGFAMTARGLDDRAQVRLYAWSVVPSLLAWPALLVPPALGVALLVAGFAAHYGMDRCVAPRLGLPAWYLPLRLRLSVVASLSLLTLLAG